MPIAKPILAGMAFAVAAALAAVSAQGLARAVEGRSVEAVAGALDQQGHDWASVVGDGLQVVIEGEAPSESARFGAISAAGGQVDSSRVIDNMRVTPAQALAAPDFAIEILRNDSGVSLIGLIPADTDRDALTARIADAADGQPVTDLMQMADYPVPDDWEPSLDYALEALEGLPRAKISVAAGRVAIEAISDSPEDKARLEADLAQAAPDGVTLALDVTAPRPIIAPFTLRLRLDEGEARFDACAADTDEAREAILAAAVAVGASGQIDCRLGLGTPSPEWGTAAALGIDALGALGGGTLTVSDADMALVAAEGTSADIFDEVVGKLENALPAPFVLRAERPVAAVAEPEGPPQFVASLSEEGALRLRGRLPDADASETVQAYAHARFGGDVTMATRTAEDLPGGWSVRVLAGLEALALLADGTVTVTPDLIEVSGRTGQADAGDAIARGVIAALGPEAETRVDVAYVEALDPLSALPTPEECLQRITALTSVAKITFDPGSATLSGEGAPVVESVAEILKACADLRLRIAGYTDSQGRDSMNQELSQDRADAVLEALREMRVPVTGFEAVGYGEVDPIADNDTEAGREENRRIAFSLINTDAAGEVQGPALPPDEREGGAEMAGETEADSAEPSAAAQGGEASAEAAMDGEPDE